MANLEDKVFMICPVRDITDEEKKFLINYKEKLKNNGCKVHYPPEDTNQNDPIGLNICNENRAAILSADAIHMYHNPGSTGSVFDLGMTFMAEKPLYIINTDSMLDTEDDFSKFLFTYAYNTELSLFVPLHDTLLKRREKIKKAKAIKYKWKDELLKDKVDFLFDFGMVFMAEKPVLLTNRKQVERTPYKSFQNVLLELDKKYRK